MMNGKGLFINIWNIIIKQCVIVSDIYLYVKQDVCPPVHRSNRASLRNSDFTSTKMLPLTSFLSDAPFCQDVPKKELLLLTKVIDKRIFVTMISHRGGNGIPEPLYETNRAHNGLPPAEYACERTSLLMTSATIHNHVRYDL